MYGREQSGIRLEMTKKPIILSAFDNSSTGILTVHHINNYVIVVKPILITPSAFYLEGLHLSRDSNGFINSGITWKYINLDTLLIAR